MICFTLWGILCKLLTSAQARASLGPVDRHRVVHRRVDRRLRKSRMSSSGTRAFDTPSEDVTGKKRPALDSAELARCTGSWDSCQRAEAGPSGSGDAKDAHLVLHPQAELDALQRRLVTQFLRTVDPNEESIVITNPRAQGAPPPPHRHHRAAPLLKPPPRASAAVAALPSDAALAARGQATQSCGSLGRGRTCAASRTARQSARTRD